MEQVMGSPELMTGFDDPEVMAAVNDIAANPQAVQKYKSNPKVRSSATLRLTNGIQLDHAMCISLDDDTLLGPLLHVSLAACTKVFESASPSNAGLLCWMRSWAEQRRESRERSRC